MEVVSGSRGVFDKIIAYTGPDGKVHRFHYPRKRAGQLEFLSEPIKLENKDAGAEALFRFHIESDPDITSIHTKTNPVLNFPSLYAKDPEHFYIRWLVGKVDGQDVELNIVFSLRYIPCP